MASDTISSANCYLIGDVAVGKTCLLMTFVTNSFPSDYIPTVFDCTSACLIVDGNPVTLYCYDTHTFGTGEEDKHNPRPLARPRVDVFLLCFDVTRASTLQSVEAKWSAKLNSEFPSVPVVLVGTKVDLRDNNEELEEQGLLPVTHAQGVQMQRKIGAFSYVECSSLKHLNLRMVFEEAARASLLQSGVTQGKCSLL
eukprot:Em0007g855a